MLEVSEALDAILLHSRPLPAVRNSIVDACGSVLAEDVASDVDSPPYSKSLMDGYAVRSDDFTNGSAVLSVLEEITAGTLPTKEISPGKTSRVMTGAPIPEGADAVVRIEKSELIAEGGGERVRLDGPVKSGQSILSQGTVTRAGEIILRKGHLLQPSAIGLLAEAGMAEVSVIRPPRVAVLGTGNELVSHSVKPAPAQIRNSNSPMLLAFLVSSGAIALDLGTARDDVSELEKSLARGMEEADVLVITGGVSAGILDLVPSVLGQLGVTQVFHKVRLKPGKPIWFGTRTADNHTTLVFGLPGNPVSTLVCFELFVRQALNVLAGRRKGSRQPIRGRLRQPYEQRGDRPTYHPSKVTRGLENVEAEPLPWQGSADLRALADANALIHFPAGDANYESGDEVDVFPFQEAFL